MTEKVLVTGGTGFLGRHAVTQLLEQGYHVRTTVRSLRREAEVRAAVDAAGVSPDAHLEVVAADLSSDHGWAAAADGMRYVLHIASPIPAVAPKTEDELIIPARDGALRVLRAARDAGVERVVMTSSFWAIGFGHTGAGPFDETVWTNVDGPITPYVKSKTLAERAAWRFMDDEGGPLELVTINPTGIFGPAIGPGHSPSLGLIKAMLDGKLPFLPDIKSGVVDVRDLAALHIMAMTAEHVGGQRFIAAGGYVSMAEIAEMLRSGLGQAAAKIPTWQIPTWLLKTVSLVVKPMREMSATAGVYREPALNKATRALGWRPRPTRETIIDSARSLLALDHEPEPSGARSGL
ncbi:SDR family oxidoreductase [Actinoplanes sp. NPDC049265]|uniref:SDR family oxidoreductase n=1 Tax=Actinoplanes sp. NPDC049265 TaxID=3363902 RepID=UPI00371C6230